MVSVRSPDNCMFSWSQAENSELKLILVLAWSSYSPPPQEWIVSLQDERRRAGAGVGESSQMGRIIFFLHPVPLCSSWAQSPDLAVEGTARASELLWSQETQKSLLRWGLSASSLFPPFPQSWEGRRRMTSQKTQSDEDGSHLDLQSPRKPCWLTPVVSEARQDSLVSSRPA